MYRVNFYYLDGTDFEHFYFKEKPHVSQVIAYLRIAKVKAVELNGEIFNPAYEDCITFLYSKTDSAFDSYFAEYTTIYSGMMSVEHFQFVD